MIPVDRAIWLTEEQRAAVKRLGLKFIQLDTFTEAEAEEIARLLNRANGTPTQALIDLFRNKGGDK